MPILHRAKILTALMSFALAATAQASGSPLCGGPAAQHARLTKLLQPLKKILGQPGAETFVIFMNGDGDHYVVHSTAVPSSDVFPSDANDAYRIESAARACQDCNVIELHIRDGSDCKLDDPDAQSSVRVWERGQLVASRSTPVVNAADPKTLAQLLQFAEAQFPETEMNLVYRGHSFYPDYDPKAVPQTLHAFATSFKDSKYGVATFAESLDRGLSRPLKSLTLAACRMAYLEVADSFAPYADVLVAPQVDILEVLNVGFDYQFIYDRRWPDVSQAVVHDMLYKFNTSPHIEDAMMETPVTRFDLLKLNNVEMQIQNTITLLMQKQPRFFGRFANRIYQATRVKRVVSDRYIRQICPSVDIECIKAKAKPTQVASPDNQEVDLQLALEMMSRLTDDATVRNQLKNEVALVQAATSQFNKPYLSNKRGVSIRMANLAR